MTYPPVVSALPPGVDVDAVAADLADDGVAAPAGTDPSAVVAAVGQARSDDGLALSVVVLPGDVGESAVRELAQALRDRGEGTVLVLSDGGVAASSNRYTDDEIAAAVQAGVRAGDDPAAVRAFSGELTGAGPPWGWIVGAFVLLTAVVAVAVRLRDRRRRAARDVAALHAEGERLREAVAALAERVVRYEPRIPLTGDDTLDAEFDRLSVDYAALAQAVAADPADRTAVGALDARVAAVEGRLDAVGARLGDEHRPGADPA